MSLAVAILLVSSLLAAGCTRANPNPVIEPAKPSTEATSTAKPNTPAEAGHQVITITAKGFVPAAVTVKVGTRVVWNNEDKSAHDVTLEPSGPSSGSIKPGTPASHVFDKAGTFPYHDALHPALKGTITVK